MSEESEGAEIGGRPPLFVVRGDASAEEVAALGVVLTALAATASAPDRARADRARRRPRSAWASAATRVGAPLRAGPTGWRASALPR